jgi:hypothetical protein
MKAGVYRGSFLDGAPILCRTHRTSRSERLFMRKMSVKIDHAAVVVVRQ